MSWSATSYVKPLLKAPNGKPITKGEKLLLYTLADYYNDEMRCAWPSLARLADESLHTRRGAVLALRSLEEKGLLVIVRHPDARSKRLTNHYHFPGLKAPLGLITKETTSLGLGKLDAGTRELERLELGKQLPPILSEETLKEPQKDIGAEQVLDTESRSVSNTRTGSPKSNATYKSYAERYLKRYGVPPVRNAKANALMCQLVDRLGAEEAPLVAAFYVSLDTPQYAKVNHPLNQLLRDCEGIRTQWKTSPIRAPIVGGKAFQPAPLSVPTTMADCPAEAAAALSRILGREAFSFPGDRKGLARQVHSNGKDIR